MSREAADGAEVSRASPPRAPGPLFIPLDDRPCTRDFPSQLAALVGWRLPGPPLDRLGWCERPGDADALLDWLAAAPLDGGAILSVEMLLFGGLVGSRRLDLDPREVERRADRLEGILAGRRQSTAFSVVMRVPPYCTSDADRRFAERLLAWSQAAQRGGVGVGWRAARLERSLPADFVARYRAARARNHAVNARFLDWARRGLLDFALLGMDDSRTEGFNVAEREALAPRVRELGERAALVPGADELALLLLARRALARARRRPTVEVRFAPESLRQRVTRYEDRPVGDLVAAHCRAAGVETVAKSGDILLHVHGPTRAQAEAATQILPPVPSRRLRMEARGLAGERFVAVADLGYANGADRGFVAALAQEVPLAGLGAYAAWNTAGNTVGTALAHAVLRWLSLSESGGGADLTSTLSPASRLVSPSNRSAGGPSSDSGGGADLTSTLSPASRLVSPSDRSAGGPSGAREAEAVRAHVSFLLERFVDDWLWQAVARQEVGAWCAVRGLNAYALGDQHRAVEAEASRRLIPPAQEFFARHFTGREVRGPGGSRWRVGSRLDLRIELPWPRIFEVRAQCGVEVEPA